MADTNDTPVVDNTLPPVVEHAFGKPKEGAAPTPEAPQDRFQTTLDEILKNVRGDAQPPQEAAAGATPPEEAVPESTPPAETEGKPAVVSATGNKALDIAVSAFVKSTGMTEADITSAMSKAYETGNIADIDKAFLKERFGDNADAAIGLAEAVMEHELAASQAMLKSIFDVAGGEDKFKSASDVFKQHADADTKAAIREMLDSNNPALVKFGAKQIVEFAQRSGVLPTVQGTKFTAGSGFAESSGLSKTEFQAAVVQLQANPSRRTYHEDMARLMELRRIGKQLGK